MRRIYFDIETGPLPESELLPLLPVFDPAEVKNGDGKEFAQLWQSDREKAMASLKNDVELTARIAESLGCVAA